MTPEHRRMSETTGSAFEVYTTLKMGVLFYKGFTEAQARGADDKEAVIAGLEHAGAWMGFVCLSLCMPLIFLGVPLFKILDYYGPFHPELTQSASPTRFWSITSTLGSLALVTQVVSWLVLYCKLKDKLRTKRGRIYRWGFRIRRRFFLLTPWWAFVLASCSRMFRCSPSLAGAQRDLPTPPSCCSHP